MQSKCELSDKSGSRWQRLVDGVLRGEQVTADEAIDIVDSPDEDLLDLLAAAYQIRRRYFGNTVQLYFLVNAKSGICPEDCHYCSQSKVSDADIPKYKLLGEDELLEGARRAAELHSRTYCIVISGRGPTDKEMQAITRIVPKIKDRFGLHICTCLGLLTPEQASELKACGVDRVNHNLNTSEEHYSRICTTHTYHDRMETLRNAKAAGLELCSGGILGMGETPADLVRMAFDLRALDVQSIPINFLNPIAGTPLEAEGKLNPRQCLKTLAMFRFVHPDREIRIAGGREMHLRSLQPLGLYAANSVFVGDYLTTKGQAPIADYRMIEDLGFQIVVRDESGREHVREVPARQPLGLGVLESTACH